MLKKHEDELIASMWRQGIPAPVIAGQLYVSPQTVSARAKALGLPQRHAGRTKWADTISKEDLETFINQWNTGMSRKAMAIFWEVDPTTISKRAMSLGLEKRSAWHARVAETQDVR